MRACAQSDGPVASFRTGKAVGALVVAWAVLGVVFVAAADTVRLKTGRRVAVHAIHSDPATGRSRLVLPDGGEIECRTDLIAEILADAREEEVAVTDSAMARPPVSTEFGEPSLQTLPHGEVVERVAVANGLRPSLIHAVVAVESDHRPAARSPKGAMGLMQLMPATARAYGLRDPFDIESNLDVGVRHLRDLLTRHPLPLALAAYNAGESAVTRYHGIPPYPETQSYVERVLSIFRRLASPAPIERQRSSRSASGRRNGSHVE